MFTGETSDIFAGSVGVRRVAAAGASRRGGGGRSRRILSTGEPGLGRSWIDVGVVVVAVGRTRPAFGAEDLGDLGVVEVGGHSVVVVVVDGGDIVPIAIFDGVDRLRGRSVGDFLLAASDGREEDKHA